MAVRDRLRVWAARQLLKGAEAAWVPQWVNANFVTPTFRHLTAEGFRANSAVFACVSTLAFAFPEPRLGVRRATDGKPILDHPLLKLLWHPNPSMGQAELLQHTIIYMAIGGNCYWHKVRSKSKRVVELWPYSDGYITPIKGKGSWVDHYEYQHDSGTPRPIPVEDIIHFKWEPDPLNPWTGLSPILGCAREVDTDNEAARYLFTLLKNDAIPRLAITRSVESMALSPEEYKRQKEQWRDQHGEENRGGVALLEPGMDIKTISLGLQQLGFEALRRVPEARLAAALRVPPVLAGLSVGLEKMTYNNVGGMRRFFTEDTLVPLWRIAEDGLTANLLPEFSATRQSAARVAFDTANVMALSENVVEKRKWVDNAVVHGYMKVNEARALLGLSNDAGQDVYLRPVTQTPQAAKRLGSKRIAEAVTAWDRTMGDYAGLLEATHG